MMNLSLAWRNVWRNKMRSLIIAASVAIGLFAGLFVLGLYAGMMRARVRTVIDAEVAHLQIHHPDFKSDYDPSFTLANPQEVVKELHQIPSVVYIASRSITQGMLATTTGTAGVQINGIDMESENNVSQMNKKIIEGNGLTSEKKNGILIGRKQAKKMKLKVGSKLVLTFTDSDENITAGAFRVNGIYETVNAPLDERNVFVNQSTLNRYLNIDGESHEIAIILHSDEDVEEVKQILIKRFPEYSIKDWRDNSPETDLMVGVVDQYSAIIMVIIMISLAFGIANTMLMSVLERTREIGMLSALGMNRVRVFTLVLSETILLTLVGIPVGLTVAWLVIFYFAHMGIDISSFSGEAMSGFGFGSVIYPEFPAGSLMTVMMIVVATALIAALFPSLKAVKLQPADALRQ
jgi:putative ABC transport system permease protein